MANPNHSRVSVPDHEGKTTGYARDNRPRVLFACDGWPSGMIDLASWINHRRLTNAIVFQFQPGRLFRLDSDCVEEMGPGFVTDSFRGRFESHGVSLREGAYLRATAADRWKLQDRATGTAYWISPGGAGFDVLSSEPPPDIPFSVFAELGNVFAQRLRSFRPHVVGFRVEGADIDTVRRRVEAVRLAVDAEIVLGGPTATSRPRETLEATGADYVFAHETEESFALLLDAAIRDNSFKHAFSVPGLTYRFAGMVFCNEPPRDGYGRLLTTPTSIPRPAPSTELLRKNRLDWGLLEDFKTEFDGLYFTGGRGCPGECTFCAQLHGTQVRTKTAEQLLEEIAATDRLVQRGELRVSRWPLFEHTDNPELRPLAVSWASVYDEDFFLDRRRAVEFLRLWDQSSLKTRYRLGFQTNPRSLLKSDGRFDPELLEWIGRLSPMIQLGAESFHSEVLRRWRKRHTVEELETVLDTLDTTGQDYGVFILWTDFETTVEELLDSLRLLALAAWRHPKMRIASSPCTIPLYESDVRRSLEFRSDSGCLAGRVGENVSIPVWEFERPQPGWMDPFVAELADLIDESLQHALNLPTRDAAIIEAVETVRRRMEKQGRPDWIALTRWMHDDVVGHRIDAHLGQ